MNSVMKEMNKDIPVNGFHIAVVPFFISLYFLLFPTKMFYDSTTVFGRLVAVSIIIYYTYIHILYGVIACILFVLYYQSDFIRDGFRAESENILPNQESPDKSGPNESTETLDPYSKLSLVTGSNDFLKKHCVSDKLMYRNLEVKHPETIPHLFPEISFEKPCNPCNSTCAFSVLSKIKTEQEIAPKQINEPGIHSYLMDWTHSLISKSEKSEPYIGVKTINASYV